MRQSGNYTHNTCNVRARQVNSLRAKTRLWLPMAGVNNLAPARGPFRSAAPRVVRQGVGVISLATFSAQQTFCRPPAFISPVCSWTVEPSRHVNWMAWLILNEGFVYSLRLSSYTRRKHEMPALSPDLASCRLFIPSHHTHFLARPAYFASQRIPCFVCSDESYMVLLLPHTMPGPVRMFLHQSHRNTGPCPPQIGASSG